MAVTDTTKMKNSNSFIQESCTYRSPGFLQSTVISCATIQIEKEKLETVSREILP
jgi:hypothetical protein